MSSTLRIVFRVVDFICVIIALRISSWFVLPYFLNIFSDNLVGVIVTGVVLLLFLYMLDCYSIGREDFKDSVVRVVMAISIGTVLSGLLFSFFEAWRVPRLFFVLQVAVNVLLALAWRYPYYVYSRRHVALPESVIFFGAAMAGRARRVLDEHAPESRILGYVGEEGAEQTEAGAWLGTAQQIFAIIQQYKPTRVIVLDTFYLEPDIAHRLFAAKLRGLKVDDMRGLYERLAARVPIDLIEDEWLLLENGFRVNTNDSSSRVKRALDICLGVGLLVFTFPLLLLAALCVRLDSPGPVIYRQKRVGLHGVEFTLYKIRSMCEEAEKNGIRWTGKNDTRITRVGRCIRKTRIDELPQLVNVIKGDMSLIGPRPERMDFVKELAKALPYYKVRHAIRPGITGWAQVCYPYGASIEDARQKLEYDLYYIKNISFMLEIKILLKTIGVVLFPKGAR